jgi:hypothetical protein
MVVARRAVRSHDEMDADAKVCVDSGFEVGWCYPEPGVWLTHLRVCVWGGGGGGAQATTSAPRHATTGTPGMGGRAVGKRTPRAKPGVDASVARAAHALTFLPGSTDHDASACPACLWWGMPVDPKGTRVTCSLALPWWRCGRRGVRIPGQTQAVAAIVQRPVAGERRGQRGRPRVVAARPGVAATHRRAPPSRQAATPRCVRQGRRRVELDRQLLRFPRSGHLELRGG